MQNWRTHTTREKHKQAVAMRACLQDPEPAATEEQPPPAWGSAEWLAVRQATWRRLHVAFRAGKMGRAAKRAREGDLA